MLIACAIAAAVAFAVGLAGTLLLRRLGRRMGLDVESIRPARSPLVLLLVVLAVRTVVAQAEPQPDWADAVVGVFDVVAISVAGWVLLVAARVFERAALRRRHGHRPAPAGPRSDGRLHPA